METIKQNHIEKWAKSIGEGIAQIEPLQSSIEGLANVLGVGGMQEGIDIAFQNLYEAADDLKGQLSLMEDEIEGDKFTEVVRLDDGTFAVVAAEES